VIKLSLLLSVPLFFMGCSMIEAVKPWEKETLAIDIMQYEGLHPEVKKFEAHVYFSKEASRGGGGIAGGGCGCN